MRTLRRIGAAVALLGASITFFVLKADTPAFASGPAIVQTGTVITSGSKTLALTLPGASTSGNLLIALMSAYGDSTTPTGPGGWSQAITGSGSGTRRSAIYYYANNPGSISSATFTFGNSTTYAAGQLIEWSGIATNQPLDVYGRNNSASSTTLNVNGNQSNNSQTSYANEIEVATFQEHLTSASTVTFTPGASWTNIGSTAASSVTMQYTSDYQTGLSNGASPSETETSSVSSDANGWEGLIASFVPTPTCTGGSLSSGVSSFNFNGDTLNGKDQTVNGSPTFTPTDNTGSGSGWNLQLTSTQFTVSGHTLSATATKLNSASDSSDAGTCVVATNSVTYPITIPAGAGPPSAVKIYNAAANTGKGDSQLTLNFQMSLPASTYAGHYTSTWTFTIASGP